MTNVDVAALASELSRLLVGARLDKAYQPAKDRILLRLRQRGLGRQDLLFELGRFLTVTKRRIDNPDQPSMVAKILRQDYGNARVVGVSQIGFDRLLRIEFERDAARSLVFELFGDGNMLLLDADDVIALPMKGGDYGARRLRKGEPYQPPPGGAQPFAMDLDALRAAGQDASKDLVRFLALGLGFGPLWAEELCLRSGVDKKTKPPAMDDDQWRAIHDAIQALGQEIARNDLAPGIVHEGDDAVDAVPFAMHKYPADRFAIEEAGSFREALDAFFVGGEEDDEDPRQGRYDEAHAKIQRQIDQMQRSIDGFLEDEQRHRTHGDALYASFQRVQATIDQLQAARQSRSWQEVAATIQKAREAGDEAAQDILEIRPHNGTARLRVRDVVSTTHDIDIDLYKSVQENADDQYSAAKKAKSRQDGALKALGEAKRRLKDLEAKGLEGFGAAPTKADRTSRHFWFETFRWTPLPSGLVAVGGRSAAQNDTVVKKYLRDGDRYVHAEIHGAPSVVVRPADGAPVEISEDDLRAAGQFAACSSRAWRQFGAASAYWVTPSQVNKTPRSGEFVPKGAWIVHGKRNQMADLPMQWAIGKIRIDAQGKPVPIGFEMPERGVEKLAGGPPHCITPFASEVLRMEPGDMEPAESAAMLVDRFDVSTEEAQAVLPPGPVRVVQ